MHLIASVICLNLWKLVCFNRTLWCPSTVGSMYCLLFSPVHYVDSSSIFLSAAPSLLWKYLAFWFPFHTCTYRFRHTCLVIYVWQILTTSCLPNHPLSRFQQCELQLLWPSAGFEYDYIDGELLLLLLLVFALLCVCVFMCLHRKIRCGRRAGTNYGWIKKLHVTCHQRPPFPDLVLQGSYTYTWGRGWTGKEKSSTLPLSHSRIIWVTLVTW